MMIRKKEQIEYFFMKRCETLAFISISLSIHLFTWPFIFVFVVFHLIRIKIAPDSSGKKVKKRKKAADSVCTWFTKVRWRLIEEFGGTERLGFTLRVFS
jgi:hypothetical protein